MLGASPSSRLAPRAMKQQAVQHAQMAGTVAVVTGVSNPLGRAIARRLAAECRRLAVADSAVDPAFLADLGRIRALNRLGEAPLHIEADATTDAGARAVVRAARDAFGHVDTFVHAAALPWTGAGDRLAVDLAPFGPMTRRAAALLRAQGEGHLVLAALARSAWRGPLGEAAHAAVEAAFGGFVRVAARQLCVGTIGVVGLVVEDAAERAERALELAVGAGQVGQRRQAQLLSDAAATVRFLASSEARGLCGQVLYLGGGRPAEELPAPAAASEGHSDAPFRALLTPLEPLV